MSQKLLTPESLVRIIPRSGSIKGWQKARSTFDTVLTDSWKLVIISNDNRSVRIPNQIWQDCFNKLIVSKAGDLTAYSARMRHQAILKKFGEILLGEGIITDESLPVLNVPPKHPRKQAVNIERLRNKNPVFLYRLCDFETLATRIVANINGVKPYVDANLSNQYLQDRIIESCLFSGFIQNDPVQILYSLTWNDFLVGGSNLTFLPYFEKENDKRSGGIWIVLSPFTQFLLLCLKYRRYKKSATQNSKIFIFPDQRNFRSHVNQILNHLIDDYHLPCLKLANLIELEKLHLRIFLNNNLYLSVLSGMVKINSLPIEQANREYTKFKGDDTKIAIEIETDQYQHEDEIEEDLEEIDDETERANLELYSQIIDELTPHIKTFIFKRSLKSREVLEKWITGNNEKLTIPHQNIAKLISWLLSIKHEPQTTSAYWAANMRLLKFFDNYSIDQLDQSLFTEFINSDYEVGSKNLSKTAWKQFYEFLQSEGYSVPQIEWSKLRIWKKFKQKFTITSEELSLLLQSLSTPYKWAVQLSFWCGLRVSEVCRLKICDFQIFDGRPFVYIRKSKRKKRRKVSLEHLDKTELEQLREFILRRTSEQGLFGFVLPNTNNQPMNSLDVSRTIGEALCQKSSKNRRFHELRGAFANYSFSLYLDIRFTSRQLGHSIVRVTHEHYLNNLDLHASIDMENWLNPLFNCQTCIPVKNISHLLGFQSRQFLNYCRVFNESHSDDKLMFLDPSSLPDGKRPDRIGAKMRYLSVNDAIRLLKWMIENIK